MITTIVSRFRGLRRFAVLHGVAACALVLPAGCGEPAAQQSTMPSQEWIEKLVKEHPELFVKKVGRKLEKIEGRDRRGIIRDQWAKAQQQGTQ